MSTIDRTFISSRMAVGGGQTLAHLKARCHAPCLMRALSFEPPNDRPFHTGARREGGHCDTSLRPRACSSLAGYSRLGRRCMTCEMGALVAHVVEPEKPHLPHGTGVRRGSHLESKHSNGTCTREVSKITTDGKSATTRSYWSR
jgi:hypothetical protein